MSMSKETKIYKTFIVSSSLVIALILSGMFWGVSIRTRQLIYEENIIHARTLFNSIVLARKWNAGYGGVYVEKKEGVISNPYLENPDIKTIDGKTYTKRNPAIMTREISRYAEKEGLYKFHITSLNPVNPDNKPDKFEEKALNLFEKAGKKETFHVELLNNRMYFKYMAPLYVEEECLQCHLKQGYKLGDVRGGISVTFDIEDIQDKLRVNTYLIIFGGIITTSLLLGLIYFFTGKLTKKISEAQQQLKKMAITDDLTGIFNRRHIISRFEEEFEKARRLKKSLGCIMLDIDNFKSINDSYGHYIGDDILKEVSNRIKNSVRIYDVLGRYGGEEFLVVLPDTNFEDTKILAERVREGIRKDLLANINVAISLGVTCIQDKDESINDIIKRADKGLYMAKSTGKDRVGWID